MKTLSLALLLSCATALSSAHGQIIKTLVSESFNWTGDLNGRIPTISAFGTATWKAASTLGSNGTALQVPTSVTRNAIFDLGSTAYLSNNPGKYTFGIDAGFASATSNTQWIAMGFVQTYDASTPFNFTTDGRGGSPWMMYRENGALLIYGGRGAVTTLYSGAAGSFYAGTNYNFKMVLDTNPIKWTLGFFVNDVALDLNGASAGTTYTFGSNPVIRYFGLSSQGSAGGNVASVDNLQLLAVIPEPSTTALVLGSFILLGCFFRKRHRA